MVDSNTQTRYLYKQGMWQGITEVNAAGKSVQGHAVRLSQQKTENHGLSVQSF